jgi:hypothetical protein
MSIYHETHLARWSDDLAGRPFSVNIARMDKPEVFKAWFMLSDEEREILDSEVFYFVDAPDVFDLLYQPDFEEFFLVDPATNTNKGEAHA